MYWGRWFDVSTLECLCWIWMSVKKGRLIWTSSSRWQSFAFLHVQNFSSFIVDQLIGIGVPQGRMAPISLLSFPPSQFCLSPSSRWRENWSFVLRSTVWILSNGTPVGTGRLVVLSWQYAFYWSVHASASSEKCLFFRNHPVPSASYLLVPIVVRWLTGLCGGTNV